MSKYKYKNHIITLKSDKHCNDCPWFIKEVEHKYYACNLLSERLIENNRHDKCPLEQEDFEAKGKE